MVSLWLPCNPFLMAELAAQPSLSKRSNPFGGVFLSHPLMFLKLTGAEHPRFCPNITCWMAEFTSQFQSHWGIRHPSDCTHCAAPVTVLEDLWVMPNACRLAFQLISGVCFWVILLTVPWLELQSGLGCFSFIHFSWMHPKQERCATSAPTALQLLTGLERAKPKAAPQSQDSVDANSVVFDRASPCWLLADTHHLQQHNTAGGVVWYNNQEHHSAVTIFTVSNQTRLQFIHKLLMLSKQALGAAAFLFILAVLCTALVVGVGSLAHGPTVSQAAPHSKYFWVEFLPLWGK